jgi:hypothetical protein
MPTMSPESHVVEAAQRLTTALKGNIPTDSETAVGLTKLGELFNQIATAKAAAAAKQLELAIDRQTIKMHPTPAEIVPVPRVEVPIPRVKVPIPRVAAAIPIITAPIPTVPPLVTIAQREAPASRPASSIPNFISQDDDDIQHDIRQHSYNTRASNTRIIQEQNDH